MKPDLVLELFESMLSNHVEIVCAHPEQIYVLRVRLVPFVIRILSERVSFSTTVRAMRLLPVILDNMLGVLASECEMVLSLLTHLLDPDAAVTWKRVLCMEIFKSIYAQPALVRSIYAHFDEREGKRNIIQDHLASLVRLASEKPSIIGLGRQSSMPAASAQGDEDTDEQAALQAEGIAGTIGVAMTIKPSVAPGVSLQRDTMRVPCIDQLDKTDSPPIPPAYLYSLTLTCMNSFSDGVARFLLPFSMSTESKSKRKARHTKEDDTAQSSIKHRTDVEANGIYDSRPLAAQSVTTSRLPINPMTLTDHVLYSQICTSAKLVDSCWPALLAAYSTFLHAALDTDYYHALVRSFQKFTQISGLLRLSTPRDAFLTTLGKNAVPPAVVNTLVAMSSPLRPPVLKDFYEPASKKQDSGNKSIPVPRSSSDKIRESLEMEPVRLNSRNLLCLRALLNLGIALGPILDSAWPIVLETLQHADLVITQSMSQRRQVSNGQATPPVGNDSSLLGDIGNEISAAKIAATKMIEICADLPEESFLRFLEALKGLLRGVEPDRELAASRTSTPLVRSTPSLDYHKPISLSSMVTSQAHDTRGNRFVIDNLHKLINCNSSRLIDGSPAHSGWDIIVDTLISVVCTRDTDAELRWDGAKTLCNLVQMTAHSESPSPSRDKARQQGLLTLQRLVGTLYSEKSAADKTSKTCDQEIHRMLLDTLRSSLEHYGDSLTLGWDSALIIIASVFDDESEARFAGFRPNSAGLSRVVHARSANLVRSSFGSLQLICSDFLGTVELICLPRLLTITQSFCLQKDDFNISLTASLSSTAEA